MVNHNLKQLGVAIASAAISVAIVDATPASAARITYDFSVDSLDPLLASIEGSLSFDDSKLSGGDEIIVVRDEFKENFNDDFAQLVADDGLEFSLTINFFDFQVTEEFWPQISFLKLTDGKIIPPTEPPSFDFSSSGLYVSIFDDIGVGGAFIGRRIGLISDPCLDNPAIDASLCGFGRINYTLRTDDSEPPTSVPEPSAIASLAVLGSFLLTRTLIKSPSP